MWYCIGPSLNKAITVPSPWADLIRPSSTQDTVFRRTAAVFETPYSEVVGWSERGQCIFTNFLR